MAIYYIKRGLDLSILEYSAVGVSDEELEDVNPVELTGLSEATVLTETQARQEYRDAIRASVQAGIVLWPLAADRHRLIGLIDSLDPRVRTLVGDSFILTMLDLINTGGA